MSALQGKTVLLTRSDEANSEIATHLESKGARTLSLPTVRFTDPDSWDMCDSAILHLRDFDAVLFTSSNAVRALLKRIGVIHPEGLKMLHSIRTYAVGERTRDSLEAAGVSATMTEGGTAGDFADSVGEDVKGWHFFFPKSNIAREVLPEALRARGAFVDEAIVYKTEAPTPKDLDTVRNALRLGTVDILLFFSPSAVFNFTQMIGTGFTKSLFVAAIGPTTAEAARSAGFAVSVVAEKPTTKALIDSIEMFLTHFPQ
ncbi:MAG: uroporphyrinogen-III synthase [Bacteroidota bacterium]